MTTTIAYKVLTAEQWAALDADTFDGAPVDQADGYIHLSTAAQVTETVDRHFRDQRELFIAAIDLATLGDAVRWERSRHGQLFPHVYARLPRKSVIAACRLERDASGAVRIPQ